MVFYFSPHFCVLVTTCACMETRHGSPAVPFYPTEKKRKNCLESCCVFQRISYSTVLCNRATDAWLNAVRPAPAAGVSEKGRHIKQTFAVGLGCDVRQYMDVQDCSDPGIVVIPARTYF